LKFNPLSEVAYRRKLTENYLKEAEESFLRGDHRHTVESSQLMVENAAKAVIAFYRIPSSSHDPSMELLELLEQLPRGLRVKAERLAEIVHKLAPEHGRVTYGEPTRGVTPWELYNKNDAEEALILAKECMKLLEETLKGIHVKP